MEYDLQESEKDVIVESTGLLYRLDKLWTPGLVAKGIYTVLFWTDVKTCIERSEKRVREEIPGYDCPEPYAIQVEAYLHDMLPANLIVYSNNSPDLIYPDAEKYILRAKHQFESLKKATVIGLGTNQL